MMFDRGGVAIPLYFSLIAQLVEREAVNFDVTGSNPVRRVYENSIPR